MPARHLPVPGTALIVLDRQVAALVFLRHLTVLDVRPTSRVVAGQTLPEFAR